MSEKPKKAAQWRWEDIQTEQHGAYINMRLPDPSAGRIQHFPLAPGIYLSFVRIHTELWPVPPQEDSDHVLLLNYCRRGRCEVTLSNGKFAYLSDGQFALALQQLAKPCLYPNAFYEGIEVFLDLDILREHPYPMFEELGISLPAICVKFRLSDTFCQLHLPDSITELLSRMWTLSGAEDTSAMKLHLAELLLQIFRQDRPRTARTQYFTPSQVNIAKKVQAILTEDLAVEYTAKELATQFGVSETSLKTYFKGVYGENISVYLQKKRMKLAAHLLETTPLKISEIALQSGYDNQSKFASVFKKEYQTTPLEYRRAKRLEQM